MTSLVLDTHSLVWFLNQSRRLSETAAAAIRETLQSGQTPFVSAISVVEMIYLTEKRRLDFFSVVVITCRLAQD